MEDYWAGVILVLSILGVLAVLGLYEWLAIYLIIDDNGYRWVGIGMFVLLALGFIFGIPLLTTST